MCHGNRTRPPERRGGADVQGPRRTVREKPASHVESWPSDLIHVFLLALNFNVDKFMCAFFWVNNGWRLSEEDVFQRKQSIILIDPL